MLKALQEVMDELGPPPRPTEIVVTKLFIPPQEEGMLWKVVLEKSDHFILDYAQWDSLKAILDKQEAEYQFLGGDYIFPNNPGIPVIFDDDYAAEIIRQGLDLARMRGAYPKLWRRDEDPER